MPICSNPLWKLTPEEIRIIARANLIEARENSLIIWREKKTKVMEAENGSNF